MNRISHIRTQICWAILTRYPAIREVLQGWRQEYNRVRPHSALGYKPPAPEAIEPKILVQSTS
ncbi:MAG: integrase core domain-containing protein [Saccharofermentanales bacterium]